MLPLLTSDQMRQCDRFTIEELGIHSALLMENAGRSLAEYIVQIITPSASDARSQLSFSFSSLPRICILCGNGNNGGDGFVVARHLMHRYPTCVLWLGSEQTAATMSAETRANLEAYRRHLELVSLPHDCTLLSCPDEAAVEHAWRSASTSDVIIDALVGVGGSENLRGLPAHLLRLFHQTFPEKRITTDDKALHVTKTFTRPLTIALDMPTGVHADTGRAHTDHFPADVILTLAAHKTGLLYYHLRSHRHTRHMQSAQRILSVVNIGIPEHVLQRSTTLHVLELSDVARLLPQRSKVSSKHDYGRVVVIGGSAGMHDMSGAPMMTALAALRSGAGLVRLLAPRIHPATPPEIMTTVLPIEQLTNTSTSEPTEDCKTEDSDTVIEKPVWELVVEALHWATVVVLGPGMGTRPHSLALCKKIVEFLAHEAPDTALILDADGLRCLTPKTALPPHTILTPHHGEFTRLSGQEREFYKQLRSGFMTTTTHPATVHDTAVAFARQRRCTLLLKHVPTIITNGERSYWNLSGNPALATAGSGDVLTGIIAGICAQRFDPQLSPRLAPQSTPHSTQHEHSLDMLEVAALSAFLHGYAADIYAEHHAEETLLATQLIDYLPEVLHRARNYYTDDNHHIKQVTEDFTF
jgi:NAD(P)H-hydrate epimerase